MSWKPWERATPWWLRQDRPAPVTPQRRAEPAAPPQYVPSREDTDRWRRQGVELERLGQVSDIVHRLAYHEAAHALVAYRLGLPIRHASIDLAGGSGEVKRDGPDPGDVRDAMALVVAGRVGEEWRFGNAAGCGPDDALLREFERIAPPGSLANARQAAIDLIDGDALERLASALIRRRYLTGTEVASIIDEVCEPASAVRDNGGRDVVRTFSWVPFAGSANRGTTFSVSYVDGVPVRDVPPNFNYLPPSPDHQPAADNAPNDHLGPQFATDPLDVDIVDLVADLNALATSAESGNLGRQPALLAALNRAVAAVQAVA